MIKLDVTKEEMSTEEGRKQALQMALRYHFRNIRPNIVENENLYKSKKVLVNKYKYITDVATEVFIGEFPYVTTTKKKDTKKCIELNRLLVSLGLEEKGYKCAKKASISGNGYLLAYIDEDDRELPKIGNLDEEYTNIVKTSDIGHKTLFGFTCVEMREKQLNSNTIQTYFKVYMYTKDSMYLYETNRISGTPLENVEFVVNRIYPIMYGVVQYVANATHPFGIVPLFEMSNNDDRVGDFDCVKLLISFYNELQGNRIQNVKDVVNYILMLKNVDLGDENEQGEFLNYLKNRILPIKGDDVDAKYLTNPLNQDQIQTLSNDLEMEIHKISKVCDFLDGKFAQNASEPILKIKTKPLMDLARIKERMFSKELIKLIKAIIEYLKVANYERYSKVDIDFDYIDFQYTHSLPSNDADIITEIMNLYNCNVLNPSIALQNISWIKDVGSYMDGIVKKEEKVIDKHKTIQNNNKGDNATNRERQNAVPQETSQMDNKNNFNIGNSQKL